MPRFYFNLYNDVTALDEDGVDLPDVAAARAEALRSVRGLAAAQVMEQGRLRLSDRIEVVDGGVVVARVTVADAVTIEG